MPKASGYLPFVGGVAVLRLQLLLDELVEGAGGEDARRGCLRVAQDRSHVYLEQVFFGAQDLCCHLVGSVDAGLDEQQLLAQLVERFSHGNKVNVVQFRVALGGSDLRWM